MYHEHGDTLAHLPAPAGVAMGAVGAQAAALLPGARARGGQRRAAHVPAGGRDASARTQSGGVSPRIISPPNSQAFSGYARADFPHCVPRWDSGRRRNNSGSAGRGGGNEDRPGGERQVLGRCHGGGRRPAVVVSERQGVVGDEQIGLAVGVAVEPAVDLG